MMWVVHHWYVPVLLALFLFACGFYRNWEKEKRRAKLAESELAARVGDVPGSGGATESYADAELPDPRQQAQPTKLSDSRSPKPGAAPHRPAVQRTRER
jgi:hypothetical protein